MFQLGLGLLLASGFHSDLYDDIIERRVTAARDDEVTSWRSPKQRRLVVADVNVLDVRLHNEPNSHTVPRVNFPA